MKGTAGKKRTLADDEPLQLLQPPDVFQAAKKPRSHKTPTPDVEEEDCVWDWDDLDQDALSAAAAHPNAAEVPDAGRDEARQLFEGLIMDLDDPDLGFDQQDNERQVDDGHVCSHGGGDGGAGSSAAKDRATREAAPASVAAAEGHAALDAASSSSASGINARESVLPEQETSGNYGSRANNTEGRPRGSGRGAMRFGQASTINERTVYFGDFVIGYRGDRNCFIARCHLHTHTAAGKTFQRQPKISCAA